MRYSPVAIILSLKEAAHRFKTQILFVNTIYMCISKGYLKKYGISDSVLHYNKRGKKRHMGSIGNSIEERPKSVDDRIEFGHWEGDCVVGSHEAACFSFSYCFTFFLITYISLSF